MHTAAAIIFKHYLVVQENQQTTYTEPANLLLPTVLDNLLYCMIDWASLSKPHIDKFVVNFLCVVELCFKSLPVLILITVICIQLLHILHVCTHSGLPHIVMHPSSI